MSATPTKSKVERRRSREIFERAEKVLVGGVNSPVRAFRSVGGEPLIIERGSGQFLYDADGNELLDYVCSWGAMLLGHANPAVTEAIADQARRGTSYGATTELEVELATLITRLHSIDREDSICIQRHRSDDERRAAGAWSDQTRFYCEV